MKSDKNFSWLDRVAEAIMSEKAMLIFIVVIAFLFAWLLILQNFKATPPQTTSLTGLYNDVQKTRETAREARLALFEED